MLNPEEQDSQIVEPDFEPPPSHQPQYDGDPAEAEQFSHGSTVGDTQFTGLEQESYKSLVEDTQFDDLELDTQAQGEDFPMSPNTRRIIQPVEPIEKPVEISFFSAINRPSIGEDLHSGFAFRKAVKPPSFSRPPSKKVIDDQCDDTLPQKPPHPTAQTKVQSVPKAPHVKQIPTVQNKKLSGGFKRTKRPPFPDVAGPEPKRNNVSLFVTHDFGPELRPEPRQDVHQKQQSRPVSRQSHRSVTKHAGGEDQSPTPLIRSFDNAAKIKPQLQNDGPSISKDYQTFIQSGQNFMDIIMDYEKQKTVVEAQQAEISRLSIADAGSMSRINSLEEEKQSLTKKIKIFEALSAKYRNHINDVVESQKQLRIDASKIRKDEGALRQEWKDLMEITHKGLLNGEVMRAKLQAMVADTKGFVAESHSTKVDGLIKGNEILKNDLEIRMVELGREKHQSNVFQKQLTHQNAAHKELVELFKNTDYTKNLTKEDGILPKLLSSDGSTQAKITEISTLIGSLKNTELTASPSLLKLIEESYTKILRKILVQTDQSESTGNLLEALKDKIDQIRLNGETESGLNERIVELRESNATMKAKVDELLRQQIDPQLPARVQELETTHTVLSGQLETAKQEKEHAKSQIRELEEQLTSARTSLKAAADEKQKYVANTKSAINDAKTDTANAAAASRSDLITRYEGREKALEQRRSEAEGKLKVIGEEQVKLQAEISGYQQQTNQHVARIKQLEMQASEHVKLQAEISGYQQQTNQHVARIKQLEMQASEHVKSQAEISGYQQQTNQHVARIKELELQVSEHAKLQAEVSSYQQEASQRVARMKQLEMQASEREEINRNLQSGLGELAQVREFVETMRAEAAKNLEVVHRNQRDVENHLQRQVELEIDQTPLPVHPATHGAMQAALSRNSAATSTPRFELGRSPGTFRTQTPDNMIRSSQSQNPVTPSNPIVTSAIQQSQSHDNHGLQETPRPGSLRVAHRKPSSLSHQYKPSEQTSPRKEPAGYASRMTGTAPWDQQRTLNTCNTPKQIQGPSANSASEFSSWSEQLDQYDIVDQIDTSINPKPPLKGHVQNTFNQTRDDVAASYRLSDDDDELADINLKSRDIPTSNKPGAQTAPVAMNHLSQSDMTPKTMFNPTSLTKPLKSAMKKTRSVTAQLAMLDYTVNGMGSMGVGLASAQVTTASTSAASSKQAPLQCKAPARGVNKTMTNSAASRTGYKRVVKGKAPKTAGISNAPNESSRPKTPTNQSTTVSPMLPAPRRNFQKRKASDLSNSDAEVLQRTAKTPRMSFPVKSSRTVIPDSQEHTAAHG